MLAATPIGSHTHASPALREALVAADVIAAEDTRRLATLLRRIDVTTTAKVLSYFEGNEASRRVAHKLGFTWQGREEGVEFPLIGKRVSLHRTAMALTQG